MSKSRSNAPHRGGKRQRRILARGVRRDTPDVRKLSRALIDLAMAQAEAEAEATTRSKSQLKEAASGEADR